LRLSDALTLEIHTRPDGSFDALSAFGQHSWVVVLMDNIT